MTGYDPATMANEVLLSVVQSAARDLESMSGGSVDFFADPTSPENRALMWTSCLFALMRHREVDGPNMRLEHLDVESVRAAGKENGERAVEWYRRANQFVAMMARTNNQRRFGITSVERKDRKYESDL